MRTPKRVKHKKRKPKKKGQIKTKRTQAFPKTGLAPSPFDDPSTTILEPPEEWVLSANVIKQFTHNLQSISEQLIRLIYDLARVVDQPKLIRGRRR